jgi:HKD family nuclease
VGGALGANMKNTTPISIRVIQTPQQALQALEDIVTWADELHMAYAWVTSFNGTAKHWQTLPLDKIHRAVFGIHFAQTEPEALIQLSRGSDCLKVVNDTRGVFHPKVLVGIKGIEGKALIGSSNLTVGGFLNNVELNIFLSGPVNTPPLSDVLSFIDKQWNDQHSFKPDMAWILQYKDAYDKRPSPPYVSTEVPVRVTHTVDELCVSWPDYYRLLITQERRPLASGGEIRIFDHSEGSYLQEVENCQAAFESSASFAQIPLEERKLVSGWGKRTYEWFGGMRGAGEFKRLTGQSPEIIAKHLDKIPLEGVVSLETVETYLTGITTVNGIGVATATRLLSVKRPDLFLSCNTANQAGIKRIFNLTARSTKHYINLHKQIWSLPWFNSSPPHNLDEWRIWKARVALLDAILYEG